VKASGDSGHKWVVSSDELGGSNTGVVPDANDFNHDVIRKNALWGNIMNNGAGVEYYFGYGYPNSDLTCQDYRSRENMWRLSKVAWNFFHNFSIPFWTMRSRAPELLGTSSTNFCMATNNLTTIIIYLVHGGSSTINLTSIATNVSYSVRWYNPTDDGGALQIGTTSTIFGGGIRSVGFAPRNTTNDWAILIR
jgi:Putative collagen-binding domain of a collagenase